MYVLPVAGGEARQMTSDPAADFSPRLVPRWKQGRLSFAADGQSRHLHRGCRWDRPAAADLRARRGTRCRLEPRWKHARVRRPRRADTNPGMATLRLADGARPEFAAIPSPTTSAGPRMASSVLYHSAHGFRLRRLDTGGRLIVHLQRRARRRGVLCRLVTRRVDALLPGPLARSAGRSAASPATGGASTVLVDFDDPAIQHTKYGFATDGKVFYFTVGSPESDIWVADLAKP